MNDYELMHDFMYEKAWIYSCSNSLTINNIKGLIVSNAWLNAGTLCKLMP